MFLDGTWVSPGLALILLLGLAGQETLTLGTPDVTAALGFPGQPRIILLAPRPPALIPLAPSRRRLCHNTTLPRHFLGAGGCGLVLPSLQWCWDQSHLCHRPQSLRDSGGASNAATPIQAT